MRLIDADALYDFVNEQMEKETGAYTRGKNKALNIVKSALHNECAAPTIDPESLRERGHIVWKDRRVGGYKYIQCPECKKEIEVERPIDTKYPYCSRCGSLLADSFMNYCPKCGARMDLEG